jgi:tetratricopeptide (TPR) repeat protein
MKENTNTLREKVAELYNLGMFEDVITSLTDKVLETEKDEKLYVLRGNTWHDKEEYDKAIIDYNKAIEINPKAAESYLWRGITWYYKKDFDGALADYTKVIEINSNFDLAYYNRGLAWFAYKEYD